MPEITRETIDSLSEKIETLAATLPPAERAVLIAALSNAAGDVKDYAAFGSGVSQLLASSIKLRPGTSLPASQLAGRGTFIPIRNVIKGSKI
jgi:hypothetical protein